MKPNVDLIYAEAIRKLDLYIQTGLDGYRQQAWDRLLSVGMELKEIEPTIAGARFLLGHLRASRG